jgi:glycosyltransferase involved in cell wall biosynthesis
MSLGIVRPPQEQIAEGPLQVLHVVQREALERLGPMLLGLGKAFMQHDISSTFLTDAAVTALQLGFDAGSVRSVSALTGWQHFWSKREWQAQVAGDFDLIHFWSAAAGPRISAWSRRESLAGVVYISSDQDIRQIAGGAQRGLKLVPATQLYAQRLQKVAGPARCSAPIRVGIEPPKLKLDQPPDTHVPVVMWSGRMEETRGLTLLAEAVRLLREDDIELQVALLSLGGNADAAWAAMRSRKVDGMFSLVESVHMIALGLAAADVFVVPAPEPAIRLVPLESLATGTRMIVSDAYREPWVQDCSQVTRFPSGSAESLAAAMRSAIEASQKAHRAPNAAEARQYVLQQYGLDPAIQAWETLYRQHVAQQRLGQEAE